MTLPASQAALARVPEIEKRNPGWRISQVTRWDGPLFPAHRFWAGFRVDGPGQVTRVEAGELGELERRMKRA